MPCKTMRKSFPRRFIDEIEIPSSIPDSVASLTAGTTRTRNRQTLRRRILLQGQVGTRRRVSAAVQEEPLPAAEEAGGDGPPAQGLDGPAALPHDRRRALGLPRDHRVQELGGGERAVRRRHAEKAALARPGHI